LGARGSKRAQQAQQAVPFLGTSASACTHTASPRSAAMSLAARSESSSLPAPMPPPSPRDAWPSHARTRFDLAIEPPEARGNSRDRLWSRRRRVFSSIAAQHAPTLSRPASCYAGDKQEHSRLPAQPCALRWHRRPLWPSRQPRGCLTPCLCQRGRAWFRGRRPVVPPSPAGAPECAAGLPRRCRHSGQPTAVRPLIVVQ